MHRIQRAFSEEGANDNPTVLMVPDVEPALEAPEFRDLIDSRRALDFGTAEHLQTAITELLALVASRQSGKDMEVQSEIGRASCRERV